MSPLFLHWSIATILVIAIVICLVVLASLALYFLLRKHPRVIAWRIERAHQRFFDDFNASFDKEGQPTPIIQRRKSLPAEQRERGRK